MKNYNFFVCILGKSYALKFFKKSNFGGTFDFWEKLEFFYLKKEKKKWVDPAHYGRSESTTKPFFFFLA